LEKTSETIITPLPKSRLGQAFEDSKRVKEADLVQKAIKDMLSKSSYNGDDSIIRKWNREMKHVNSH
jgi:Holliday junction resolvase RusA-like endonuclease